MPSWDACATLKVAPRLPQLCAQERSAVVNSGNHAERICVMNMDLEIDAEIPYHKMIVKRHFGNHRAFNA